MKGVMEKLTNEMLAEFTTKELVGILSDCYKVAGVLNQEINDRYFIRDMMSIRDMTIQNVPSYLEKCKCQ